MADLNVVRLNAEEIPAEQWDEFVRNSPQGGVFLLHGYASIIAPGWEALIATEGERWVAILPFLSSTKLGLSRSLQPRFSQYWGLCYCPSVKEGYEALSRQKEVLDLLLSALPSFRQIIWHFSPSFTYPLPLYWDKFRLESRYTFQLDLSLSEGQLLSRMASTIRRYLRKGAALTVEPSQNPEDLLGLFRLQREAGHEIIGSNDKDWSMLSTLIRYLLETGVGRLLIVRTPEREIAAAGLYSRLGTTGTYLFGTYDPILGNRSAMPVMMWHAIRGDKAAGMSTFDFEGSMLSGVERFFRRMGGQPVAYLKAERNKLPYLIRWISELRS